MDISTWSSFGRYAGRDYFEDHIYSGGQLVRIDKRGIDCADILAGHNLQYPVIWAGLTAPYKLYSEDTLSVYLNGTPPFGDQSLTTYGMKISSQETLYKLEDLEYSGPYDLKTNTYSSDQVLLGVDYYFTATVEEAKAYAAEHSLVFPVPSELENLVWLWGYYYGLEDTPQTMKAYVEVI